MTTQNLGGRKICRKVGATGFSSRPNLLEYPPTLPFWMDRWSRDQPQPGSLFQRLRKGEKRDPGNEVAHRLAVACTEDILQDTVSKYVPNYSSLIQDSIPKRSGQKPGPKRIRPSCMEEQRDVSGIEERCKGFDSISKPEPFYLKRLSGSRVTTCYG